MEVPSNLARGPSVAQSSLVPPSPTLPHKIAASLLTGLLHLTANYKREENVRHLPAYAVSEKTVFGYDVHVMPMFALGTAFYLEASTARRKICACATRAEQGGLLECE